MKYKALIGLEMHCEITGTNTKAFSSAKNSYSTTPNENVRPVDMAFPGTLPVVNKEAVKKALMASIILNCKQPEYIYFERKNYYYPDLPKGYQITQETKPAPVGIYGYLDYYVNGEQKGVRINNIHLEEDAASLDHKDSTSTIDYNRAGVPLLELVTYPDFKNAEEAVAFLETMRSIYQYTNISEGDSKKGQIRCDVNVSIMDENLDETKEENWGTKIEIKNVNSFSAVKDAINYEIKRQIEAKENGTYDKMEQQTRRWDDEKQETVYMRSKIDAIDYKYFIEPNIPKFKVRQEWLDEIRTLIPELPNERKEKYIKEYNINTKDAETIVKEKDISDYFEKCIKLNCEPKEASNWITTRLLGYLNKNDIKIKDIYMTPEMLTEICNSVKTGKISSQQAKEVFTLVLEEKKNPEEIIKEKGFVQNSNEEEIIDLIQKVLDDNIEAVNGYKNGKTNIVGYLVGQVLKASQGKFNPGLTAKLLNEELRKR